MNEDHEEMKKLGPEEHRAFMEEIRARARKKLQEYDARRVTGEADPVVGSIYRISSRNLWVAVYVGGRMMTGIREKFDHRYLFSEELSNGRSPTGTVKHVYPGVLGRVPDDIPLRETLGTVCRSCGTPARWTGPPTPAPWVCEGGM